MKKQLPININVIGQTQCWDFYRLAILLTDDTYFN